jgi:predicted transcriptional regulator of viral defense system
MRGLEATAYSQHGYFTTSQAREYGISSQLLSHHVRRGRFERVRRGLYRLPGFPRAEDDEMREKWMAVGTDKAVLSHQSALALLELSDNIPNAVHLLLGRRYRGLRRPAGVAIHTRPDEEEVATVWREGLRLTAPARTLVDVGGEIQPEQLEMAVRQALVRGLLTARELEEEAQRRGRKGAVSGALAAVIASKLIRAVPGGARRTISKSLGEPLSS